MKPTSIRWITASAAILFGAPLAAFGFYTLATANSPHHPGQTADPPVTLTADGKRAEIRVPLGTGADISRAIAALPASGGLVHLEAGIYTIRKPLVIDRDGIELTGDQDNTVLQLADGADCPLLVIGSMETPPSHTVRSIVVRKLTLDGNRLQQENECNGGPCDNGGLSYIRNNALTIRGCEDVRVERVVARHARSGGLVLEKGCRRILVSDFTAYQNHYDGMAAYETEESFFTRLYLHDNAAAGISVDIRFNRNIISHARLDKNGSQGIFMRDSNFNNFNHLTITTNGRQGIFIAEDGEKSQTPCTGNIFSELTVTDCVGAGLRVNDVTCVANVLANSTFTGNGEGGVSEVTEQILSRKDVAIR